LIINRLEQMTGGWFLGNFSPTIYETDSAEVCVKTYKAGDTEPLHMQLTAVEVTVIITGNASMSGVEVFPGDVIRIDPLEPADFVALTDVTLVAVKSPSKPEDKVVI
jgi:mannose-6-phosphate isomerase-like protein (cupin superfamily)